MKHFTAALLIMLTFLSCKKLKENIQEKKVLDFITTGLWKVSSLEKGNVDYGVDFTGYQFQFKTNEVVEAIKNGSIQKSGTWLPDGVNYTITSNFPADAVHPLTLLNGIWKIIDGGDNFVVATQTINGEVYRLRLDKV
jgi:hypothetical protein